MKKAWNIIWKHGLLIILSVIWMIPILWLFVTSLSGYKGINTINPDDLSFKLTIEKAHLSFDLPFAGEKASGVKARAKYRRR